ncbi:MAG TPA: hypothetical protein VLU25_18310 [Acidobacteriota bacterium]|nr:hypothetical protein [Acidobacteriota bacterium]
MLIKLVNGERKKWHPSDVEQLWVEVRDLFSNRKVIEVRLREDKWQAVQESGSVQLEDLPEWADGHPLSLLVKPTRGSGYRDVWKYPLRSDSVSVCMMLKEVNTPLFSSLQAVLPLTSADNPLLASLFEVHPELVPRPTRMSKVDQTRLCCALNIEAKLHHLFGRNDVVTQIEEARRDRIICKVNLHPEDIENAKSDFSKVPAWANRVLHEGFPVSFKEKVPEGSLQVSLTEDWKRADIDIDLFTMVGHFGEVLRNRITDQKTDPQVVYRQLFDQGIHPLYTLSSE